MASNITKDIPDPSEYYESVLEEKTALDDLTRQEFSFLMEYIRGGDAATAAKKAGYSLQMSLLASTILDRPHVRKALRAVRATQRETLRQRQINAAAFALDTVQSVMLDPTVNHAVRLNAASKLIDISGTAPSEEMSHQLRDDAPMERVASTKLALAVKEAKESEKL